jgi:hypothetical protein
MNALFPLDEEELENIPPRNGAAIQQLRFNGDQKAFVKANFEDFYVLLQSGAIVSLNRNIVAMEESVQKFLCNSIGYEEFYEWFGAKNFHVTFDEQVFMLF